MLEHVSTGLHGFEDDLVRVLGPFLGADRVRQTWADAMTEVRREAAEGARDAVRPWLIGALAMGGLGLAVGLVAAYRGRA